VYFFKPQQTKADINITHSTDHVFTREELFDYFTRTCHQEAKVKKDHYMIGMVGYPNVGKSSTINVLYHRKKVAVSSTPGKTKHFQVRNFAVTYSYGIPLMGT
jgi:large subunit GTPase 1